MLDLNILPFARYAGQEYPDLMGLHVAEPPRSAARGRAVDRLVLYLVMTGNAPLSPAKQAQLLESLAKLYFATSGTATSAMRTVAEQLNTLLLNRNLRIANSGQQGMGILTQVVIREDAASSTAQVYLAHSGPNHAYLIASDGTQHFFDDELESTGLGQGRVAPVAYHQASLHANDSLILAVQPSADWNVAALSSLHGQGPESIRRRMFLPAEGDLNALLIQARPGKGKFYILRSDLSQRSDLDRSSKPSAAEEQPSQAVISPEYEQKGEGLSAPPLSQPSFAEGLSGDDASLASALADRPAAMAAPEKMPGVDLLPAENLAPGATAPAGAAVQKTAARRKFGLAPLWKVLVMIGTPLAIVFQRLGRLLRTGLARMLPVDPFKAIPNSVMLFVAFVVPVVIGTLASTVYFELGRDAQYEVLFTRAKQMAAQAAGQSDLLVQRADWEATLGLLEQVEARKSTPESQALRAQAIKALDELDLVRRLDFLPALAGLPASVNITRLVASDVDLYLLDETSGSVFHARMTIRGFELDPSFECGPSVGGVLQTGPVIDIVAWPTGFTPAASLLAMDAGGNALYCQPNQYPIVEKMSPPPNALMENLRGFALGGSDLYVLDPFSNAVWMYRHSNLDEQPSLYFDEEIPFMSDMIDLTVNNGELYLLHGDGHLTLCTPGVAGVAPARCSDPKYVDSRLGRENTPLISSSAFVQVLVTEPPDPSLYLLEAGSQAIYHFSLRNLVFQRQYLPPSNLSTLSATAFAVNPVRQLIFLAIGNQVYYASLP